jgi:hypothetical protein
MHATQKLYETALAAGQQSVTPNQANFYGSPSVKTWTTPTRRHFILVPLLPNHPLTRALSGTLWAFAEGILLNTTTDQGD